MAYLDVNQDYFKKVDTPEKAYWLGFIWADGTMRDGLTGLKISLQKSDECHLRRFKKDISGEFTIAKYGDGCIECSVTNPKFNHHLRKRGLCSDKSQTEELPHIIDELKPHFVRGFFDGDGDISEYKNKYHRFRISAKHCGRLKKIYDWMSSQGIEGGGVHSNGELGYRLSITAKGDLKKVWNMIYPEAENTEPALERKKAPFMSYNEEW